MKKSILIIVIIIIGNLLNSQVSQGGIPYSIEYGLSRSSVPTEVMPAVNVDSLLAEDELEPPETPFRFAYAHEVSYNLNSSGIWEDIGNGNSLWRLKIHSPSAYSVGLVFSRYWLPDGAKLFVYNNTADNIIGAFTSYNNKANGEFMTQPVRGDEIIIELFLPSGATGEMIEISHVVHGYRDIFSFGDSGLCNVNVNCEEGDDWQTQKRSVAMLLLSNGTRFCSGSLINNVGNNDLQYLLTANHCVDNTFFTYAPGDTLNWVFMFNYESPICENQDGPTDQTVQGAVVRAMNDEYADFALLEITEEAIPETYGVYYNLDSRQLITRLAV